MTPIAWTPALQLDFPPMDNPHQAFVRLLAQAQTAPDHELLAQWQAVLTHTEGVFQIEDRWMRTTCYPGADTHSLQHRIVLNLMREGLGKGRSGELAPLREMTTELASWFTKHTQAQDAALALHMRRHPTGQSGTART